MSFFPLVQLHLNSNENIPRPLLFRCQYNIHENVQSHFSSIVTNWLTYNIKRYTLYRLYLVHHFNYFLSWKGLSCSRALTSFKIEKTIAHKTEYINIILIYNIFPLNISCLFAALIEVFDDIHLLSSLIKKRCIFQDILAEVIKVYIKDNVNTYKKKII